MKPQIKKLKWNMIVMSLVYLVLGAVLLVWPETVLNGICYVVGGVVILSGAVQILRFLLTKERAFLAPLTLIFGIICLGLGIFLVVRSDIVLTVLPMVFGLFVIFDSVLRVQNAWDLKRSEANNWWVFLLLALLSVGLGLVMIFNPFGTVQTLVMAVGVILLIEGALNLISLLYTFLIVRRFVKQHPEVQQAAQLLEQEIAEDDQAQPVVVEGIAVEHDAQDADAADLDEMDEDAPTQTEPEAPADDEDSPVK